MVSVAIAGDRAACMGYLQGPGNGCPVGRQGGTCWDVCAMVMRNWVNNSYTGSYEALTGTQHKVAASGERKRCAVLLSNSTGSGIPGGRCCPLLSELLYDTSCAEFRFKTS